MTEPESHTLRLLREIRGAIDTSDGRIEALDRKVEALDDKVEALDGKVDRIHADLKERIDTLTRAVAGEIVQARYVTAGVDDRFAEIEKRLSALEQAR